jgi:8-oxo-dGTP pyrophosphatase MutT (NUDIX family)
MTITIGDITATVDRYLARYPDELDVLAPLRAALGERPSLTSRHDFAGHVTCGAIVVDDVGRVLHVRHRALERWLLPGGHLEPGDASLHGAAVRELDEETGVTWPSADAAGPDTMPLDIDIHSIPANPAKGEPDHRHFDFRYLLQAASPVVRVQEAEVTGFAWRPVHEITPERLRRKLASLPHSYSHLCHRTGAG